MKVLFQKSGIVFRGDVRSGDRIYGLRPEIGPGPEAILSRAELMHLRDRAAHFDPQAETDAVYNGPKFSAIREDRPPVCFGVKLYWSDDEDSREIFFQGSEWNQFLELLDTVCANERAA